MCGRYVVLTEEEMIEIREIIEEVTQKYGDAAASAMSTGEIYPTNIAPVITADGPVLMRWGFPMHGKSGVTINARSETAGEKSLFSAALRARRVIIPTSGFYEWKHDRNGKSTDKFLFRPQGKDTMYLAGLHTNYALPNGDREDRYVILTTGANESMEPYHTRMPVYVDRDERDAWITDPQATGDILHRPQPDLLAMPADKPKPAKPKQISLFDLTGSDKDEV